MKWVYYDYMGNLNPVCEDAGKILNIVPNLPAAPYTYSNILEIDTDGGRFGCDTKFPSVKYGGFTAFFPIRADNAKKLELVNLAGIRHGDTVDVKPNCVYFLGSSGLSPITTDPRVLFIMHRAHGLKPDDLPDFCKRIPTKAEAIAYLRSIHAQMECLPMSAVEQQLNEKGE